ncbi:tetratricopeptide repeat protein [Rubrivivax gelatinosus]|uniref:Uncharacterized protein n=1 Tax=Rubrivivax gelatinosus TaxID=28068 RepID=A0A4R2M5K9_RUBGE|nr:hypothetical protein [Rubrivivax gelatinosus]MBK1688156.1 hypothetical protein [Rubrivivax gelatinosus]TCP02519.1 hypothetical protein EV684_10681 [Rubrivivax gelatinosus]
MSADASPPSPRPADGTPGTPAPAKAQVDHLRQNASAVTVLLETADIRIEHFRRGGEGGTLVVTFDPILYLADRPPFGQEFLRKQALDVVAVRKKTENFYQPLSREQFDAVVGPVSARYARVVSYGSSLGAYAALYYGRDEPWTVIASSPRNSTHPVFGVDHWQERQRFLHERLDPARPVRCRAIILYDPCDPMDRRYLDGEVLPQFSAAELVRVPYSGHPSNQFLHEIGFIAPFVRAVLTSETAARPKLDRRGKRRVSTTYHQVLASACLHHGHLGWAESLLDSALKLNPRNMLAHRTRAMVKLERRDWPAAITALEQALAIDPKDTSSLVLLKRARRGDAPPPAAAPTPPPSAPPDPLRRAWRRLRRVLGLDPPPPGSR